LKHSAQNKVAGLDSIIAGCRKNQRSSQKILYDRYFEALFIQSQKYRLSDQEIITLINTTMLKVFQNIESITSLETFDGWLHTIHKNNILNHFRSQSRERNHMVYDSSVVNDWGNQNREVPNTELNLDFIRQAMDSLPHQTKKVLELYAIQGYKHREIARKLNMSESNSKYHLSKARELMAQKLKQQYE